MESKLSQSNNIEEDFVFSTYEKIAHNFSHSRYKVWNRVENFISDIPTSSKVMEVGCGNGKNMMLRDDIFFEGCDTCHQFVKICTDRELSVIQANNLNLPYDDNSYDFTLSVAVIHHISTHENRIKAIEELVRITKPGGKIFLEVWAFEQGPLSKMNLTQQDNLIPFKDKITRENLGDRFYHFFKENELQNIVNQYNVKIIDSFWEKGNWGIIIQKL